MSVLLLSFGTALAVKADMSFGPADGIVRVISWKEESEFGSVKLRFDIVMVAIAAVTSLAVLGGLDGVREGAVAAMLLIGPVVKVFTRAMHAEPEVRDAAERSKHVG